MPKTENKTTGKGSRSKAGSKSAKTTKAKTAPFVRDQKPYGDPISETIIRGDKQEMRKMVTYTKKWLKSQETELNGVRRALNRLEKALTKVDRG